MTSVRTPSRWSFLAATVLASACVDAPITADQLQPDGRLRELGGHQQAAFAAETDEVKPVKQAVQVSAVLAAEADGPLEDRNAFSADVGAIHLHVRADGLLEPRPVVYRWAHEGFEMAIPGMLAPNGAMTLGASFEIDPEQTGTWQVDVLAGPTAAHEGPRVLFHREFEVERLPHAEPVQNG